MQQRISHDFVDDEIVVYRARSGRRSLLPLLSFGLVLAVVVSAGMLGSRLRGTATASNAPGAPLASAAAVAAVTPSPPVPAPLTSPTTSPSTAPSPVLEYIGVRPPVDLASIPPSLGVATIAPQRLQGATLPQARSDSGFAANGTQIAFVAWDSIRVIDLQSPQFSSTVVRTDTCSWVPEMASAGDLLAYVLLRPATGLEDGCGGQMRHFEWQIWLTDFSGTTPALVAHGLATRPEAEMFPTELEQGGPNEAPWRPHVGVSAAWLAWSVPNDADPEHGSQTVRAVPTADRAAEPVSLETDGRVTQLAVGGSLVAATVARNAAAGSRAPESLELTDAPESRPFRTVATVEGPIGVDPNGSSIAWQTGGPTAGVVVADGTGNGIWSTASESWSKTGGAPPSFAAVHSTGVMWVAATTLDIGGTAALFVMSRHWPQGAVIVDAPTPRWGRLDGGRLTWIGDDPAGGLAAMTVYVDSLAEVSR